MIGQSEISKNLQRWDSSVYDRCSRASALEDAITACSLPTRVESADFGATLRYRVADDYSFADAEYENFHGSRGKDETVADGRNFTLTLDSSWLQGMATGGGGFYSCQLSCGRANGFRRLGQRTLTSFT